MPYPNQPQQEYFQWEDGPSLGGNLPGLTCVHQHTLLITEDWSLNALSNDEMCGAFSYFPTSLHSFIKVSIVFKVYFTVNRKDSVFS